jgi:hypothetical protein
MVLIIFALQFFPALIHQRLEGLCEGSVSIIVKHIHVGHDHHPERQFVLHINGNTEAISTVYVTWLLTGRTL